MGMLRLSSFPITLVLLSACLQPACALPRLTVRKASVQLPQPLPQPSPPPIPLPISTIAETVAEQGGVEHPGLPAVAPPRAKRFLPFDSATNALLCLLPLLAVCAAPAVLGRRALALYHGYEAAALARPLLVKAATSGCAYLLGDLIAQTVAVPRRLDRGRLFRSTFAGTFSHGPQLHAWTVFLDRFVSFGGARWALLVKIGLDQTLFALYINGAFCMLTELMQARGLRVAWAKVCGSARGCLTAGWRFWPLAHAVTYGFVPLHLRVLWVDVLEVAWVAILSTQIARSRAAPADSSSVPPAPAPGG